MKNYLIAGFAGTAVIALCLGAASNSQSGGLSALNERLADLESIVEAQAQEIECLKAQLADQSSLFTDTEVTRLQGLAAVMWVEVDPEKVRGTSVFVDASLLVRNTCVSSFLYSRGGNFTSAWTLPNEAAWTFQEARTDW